MLVEFLSFMLSVSQIISGAFLGLINTGVTEIDYGGIAYVESSPSAWLTLTDGGASDYIIIKGEGCSPSEATAANELQNYIHQISGAMLEIATDTLLAQDHEIIVGKTNRENENSYIINRDSLGDEGFTVMVADERLVIAGGELRGTLYGVYNFLEQNLGCRWFTPDLCRIPTSPAIRIDAQLNYSQKPNFEYRDDYWNTAFDVNWKVKQKINSDNGGYMPDSYGSGISYAGFCHTMNTLVPVSYFDDHPDYFSYRDDKGAWTIDQRCLTNPSVLAITIENARATLIANPHAKIISITQNDNGGYCQCPDCKESDELYGGQSGTNIWFVNQVAAALEDEFPNVGFDTFAYQYTRKPPVNIVPRNSVIVRLCSIECCFAHPLEDCGHTRDEAMDVRFSDVESSFANDLKGWAAICNRVYIWDYTTNFGMYLTMFPNFQVLSPNMQFFAENNVKGVFEQGNYTGGKSGEFGELRAYIIAKLLWDPSCDVVYHMMDFMNAYYGENSAPFIKLFLDKITNKTVKADHLFIFDWHYQGSYYTPKEMRYMESLWESAEENAGTPEQLANIQRSRLCYRHYKATLLLGEYSPLNINRLKENEKLYNDIVNMGITRLTEGRPITQTPNFWLTPVDWKQG